MEEVTFEGVAKYIKEGHCEYTINTGVLCTVLLRDVAFVHSRQRAINLYKSTLIIKIYKLVRQTYKDFIKLITSEYASITTFRSLV